MGFVWGKMLRDCRIISVSDINRLYHAIGRSMLSRYSVYAVNLLSMMILARIFSPQIFGTVTAITVFFIFFQLVAEAGLGPAIINLESLSADDRNGLFGLTAFAGLFIGGFLLLLSPVFLSFYHIPRVDEVVPYVAGALPFFAAAIVPTALLLREQAFFKLAKAGLVAEILSTVGVVGLSYVCDPLHALAAKTLIASLVSFFVIYGYSSDAEFGRPVLGAKFSAIKPLLAFSSYQFAFNFVNFFSRNLDDILVGRFMGASFLGVYNKAYQLMRYPLMLLTFSMTPAIQPVIRNHAGDIDKIESIHGEFTSKLSWIGALTGVMVFLFSGVIVRVMLGEKWGDVTPIIQILSITIPMQIVLSTSGSFFQAMKRADVLFYTGLLSAAIVVMAIVWGVQQKDLIKLSWALVVAFHFNFLQTYCVMYLWVYKKSPLFFFVRMTPMIFSALLMAFLKIEGFSLKIF